MHYDLIVIGAGWAGFTAALKAKELGLKVALIEKDKIGGTCLNRGCIPTKSLIQSAKIYASVKKAKNFGIEVSSPQAIFSQIQSRKDKIVQQLRQGMEFSSKGIDILPGEAKLLSTNSVNIAGKEIEANFILLASGSKPIEIKGLEFDAKKIISSDEILKLPAIPRSLLIVGGGVIGCEFASLFNSLGTEVTIAEKMPQLLPNEDREIAKRLETIFKKRSIKVNTGIDATSLDLGNYELVLVCVGRVPDTKDLEAEKIGIQLDRQKLVVDEYLRTSIKNIFAAGDCTGKIMLAHYAAYQGIIAAENIANPQSLKKADNAVVPNCIFTDPEISSVGLSELQAQSERGEIKINKFDFLGSGMARILDETEGFVKIISDKNSDEVLGASIIGPRATELIAGIGLAISSRLKASDIKKTIFAHPTLSESIHEALK